MLDVEEKLEHLTVESVLDAIAIAESVEEVDVLEEIGVRIATQNLVAAVADFRKASIKFLNFLDDLIGDMDRITSNPLTPVAPGLASIIKEFEDIQRTLHDDEGLRKTFESSQEVEDISNDENEISPVTDQVELPPGTSLGNIIHEPTPTNSKKFEEIADEYIRFFVGAGFKNNHKTIVKEMAEKGLKSRPRYELVGDQLGIPWWFIAGLHQLESTYNFSTHLHNGDSLSARTFRVPAGRPSVGNPPFEWEKSAIDSLKQQKLDNLRDWSLPRALWRWERYNGFGYRRKGVPTPYLWSFSTIYKKGKFVGDGVFSANAMSKQCGAATMLKLLHDNGHVDLGLDVVAEDETTIADPDSDAQNVVDNGLPNIDNNVPAGNPFEQFFQQNLSHVQNFAWHEFLVKGRNHAQNGLNTDPPRQLWSKVINLAEVLDKFRAAIGAPVVLTSVYRSRKYNESLSGSARRSQHMEFTAADFKVPGQGNTGQWADRMKQLRAQGEFEGGIGIYNTFVHVDVRGTRADWDKRT